jgi:hypothetical protein
VASNHTAEIVLESGPFDPTEMLSFSCSTCGHTVTFSGAIWDALLTENVLPDINVNDRELLVSGAVCGDCFDLIWADDEEAAA